MTIKERLETAEHLKHCRFNKEKHEYYYCDKPVFNMKYAEKWSGITTLISKYSKPFDRNGASKGVAFKEGKSQEQVLAEWDENLLNSQTYGNGVHDSYEDMFKTGVINPDYEIELNAIQELLDLHNLTPIATEYLIWFPEIKRMSCVDLPCLNPENKIVVVDFKTPEKGIKYEGFKNQRMLAPVNDLPDASFYKYSLQATFYANNFKNMGFDIAEQHYLLYIRHDECYLVPTLDLTAHTKKIIQIESFNK